MKKTITRLLWVELITFFFSPINAIFFYKNRITQGPFFEVHKAEFDLFNKIYDTSFVKVLHFILDVKSM